MSITSPPGVFDILPEDRNELWRSSYLWNYIEATIRETATQFGYREIRTPMFERTELFARGVGETSDIVSKEMYTFEDKGGRSMSLRPEGTAPVIRAFVEHQLHVESPINKLFYIAPMFRYDRPQAGRYRQHHQFGAEAIGNDSPEQDVEMIDMMYTLYQKLGLKNLKVYINSIGDVSSRLAFKEALLTYLRPLASQLSADSQRRLEANPLRILDSKDPKDQEIASKGPSILDFLNPESAAHFSKVQSLLTAINIPFEVNSKLVRGLDYYNKTVFEIVAGELGAQNSIGGGGRYDGLIKMLGGPDLPSIGFGTGIERILQTMIHQQVALPTPNRSSIFIIPLGDEAKEACFSLVHSLRANNVAAQMDFTGRKLNKVMQYADQIKAKFVVVIGENELKTDIVELKEMATGLKMSIHLSDLVSTMHLDSKSADFIRIMEEMSRPFPTKTAPEYFQQRLSQALEETQKISERMGKTLEEMEKLIQQKKL